MPPSQLQAYSLKLNLKRRKTMDMIKDSSVNIPRSSSTRIKRSAVSLKRKRRRNPKSSQRRACGPDSKSAWLLIRKTNRKLKKL